jgi:hypothetical protein
MRRLFVYYGHLHTFIRQKIKVLLKNLTCTQNDVSFEFLNSRIETARAASLYQTSSKGLATLGALWGLRTYDCIGLT